MWKAKKFLKGVVNGLEQPPNPHNERKKGQKMPADSGKQPEQARAEDAKIGVE